MDYHMFTSDAFKWKYYFSHFTQIRLRSKKIQC